ncbi:MAG: ChaN family lipoprotein [Armatimonadetes bacterium]|nr:ChaN family lipoprotein [Armatimonadota bacterium]
MSDRGRKTAAGWIGWLVALVVMGALGSPLALRANPDTSRCELWVDLLAGEPLGYPQVLADLTEAQVIYLGEQHGVARHHQWQARIVADLAREDRLLVLALEQLEAQYQPEADRYNRGEIDFATLARATEWHHRWSSYEDYRPAIEAAHQAGVPILALNARQETIRQVARGGGVARLSRSLRAELPAEVALDDPPYARLLRLQLGVHGDSSPERLGPMVEAQIARDETMAQRLVDFLNAAGARTGAAVVLTGAGHVSYGLGMPARVRRRLPQVRDRILLFAESDDRALAVGLPHPLITHDDRRAVGRPVADYVSIAFTPEPAAPATERLTQGSPPARP